MRIVKDTVKNELRKVEVEFDTNREAENFWLEIDNEKKHSWHGWMVTDAEVVEPQKSNGWRNPYVEVYLRANFDKIRYVN